MAIEITTRDTETGETKNYTITDNYIVVCAGRHYLAGTNRYPTGTTQITIKVAEEADNG